MNILLGVTGSVASSLTPKLVNLLIESGHEVKVVATKSSLHFWKRADVTVSVLLDEDEWKSYEDDRTVLHIELRDWADVLLIAPLTADTLSKMARGRADNLLMCVVRAWDMRCPVVIAPAMNTKMWNHPATGEHLAVLRRWHGESIRVALPVEKVLACGEKGIGALATLEKIVETVS